MTITGKVEDVDREVPHLPGVRGQVGVAVHGAVIVGIPAACFIVSSRSTAPNLPRLHRDGSGPTVNQVLRQGHVPRSHNRCILANRIGVVAHIA